MNDISNLHGVYELELLAQWQQNHSKLNTYQYPEEAMLWKWNNEWFLGIVIRNY